MPTQNDLDHAEQLREEGRQEVRDAVLTLWHKHGCWIPGMAYERLAEALSVPPESLHGPTVRRKQDEVSAPWNKRRTL